MLRGYRCIIFAIVGWLVLAAAEAPPKVKGEQQRSTSKEKIQPALDSIAASLKDAQKPGKLDQPCAPGSEDRNSDLCAQWKAADAAQSSSLATWIFGSLGGVIGSLTLAAAWSAAKWAKSAAVETKRSANISEEGLAEAKEANWYSRRPWITYDTIEHAFVNGDAPESPEGKIHGYDGLEFAITIKNFGNSPAISLSKGASAVFMEHGGQPAAIRFNRLDEGASAHLPPGKTITIPLVIKGSETVVPWFILDSIIAGEMDFYVVLCCFYRGIDRPEIELVTELWAKMLYRGMVEVNGIRVPRFDIVPTDRLNRMT